MLAKLVSLLKLWGCWVLIALALTVVISGKLQSINTEVLSKMHRLRDLDNKVRFILIQDGMAPQALHAAGDDDGARKLRSEIKHAQAMDEATSFHRWDLAFMFTYTPLFILGAYWARFRARSSSASWRKGFVEKTWPLAIAGAIVGLGGDLWEHVLCIHMLDGKPASVSHAIWAYWIKWGGAGLAALFGLIAGVIVSLHSWEQIVGAHRFATRARFSVLGGVLFTILLFTPPGEDIVRTVATGSLNPDPAQWKPDAGPILDFSQLGWFAVALLVLSGTCWGWARLVLAFEFSAPGAGLPAGGQAEDQLRQALPIYYGAAPFVAGACAFAVAPLRDTGTHFPIAQFFAGSFAPLLLFFGLPFFLVIVKPAKFIERQDFGPLSWTLLAYVVLAVANGAWQWRELQLIGFVPVVFLVTALFVFGLGRQAWIALLPITLLVGAIICGQPWTSIVPVIVLMGLAALASWASRSAGHHADDLHIPVRLAPLDLLRLPFSSAVSQSIEAQIAADPGVVASLQALLFSLAWAASSLQFFAPISARIGSGTILALGLGGWVTAGSALLFFTQATRFPILTCSVIVAVVCSGLMDNHGIRGLVPANGTSGGAHDPRESLYPRKTAPANMADPVPPDPFGDAFDAWYKQASKGRGDSGEPPCIIIAAEGGGIRAAFWPAYVLGTLQQASLADPGKGAHPDFASHVFAMSGVSGGSIGLSVFDALLADHRNDPKIGRMGAKLCGQDHLAPMLGALLYPDFVQRFLPVAILPDRARAFEASWERAWTSVCGDRKPNNRMAAPFLALWQDRLQTDAPWLPPLFLNSTMVETGKRVVCSSVPVRTGDGGQFIDAHDFHSHLREWGALDGNWQDVPLITAAHASARFPLVSPPGRLPSGARVVDGGYFEASAGATGLDLLDAVLQRRDQLRPLMPVIFIFLRYSSEPGLTDIPNTHGHDGSIPNGDPVGFPDHNFLDESGGIVGAAVAARGALGSYSQDAIFNRYRAPGNLTVLSFTYRGEKIPLSWSLSQRTCNEMIRQLPEDLVRPKDADDITDANTKAACALMEALYTPDKIKTE